MKTLFQILIFFMFLNSFSQHLEPSENIFEMPKERFEYHSKIRNILFKDLTDEFEVRIVVKPSFSAESVLQIQKKDSIYIAKYNIADKNIWYAENDSVKVKTSESFISKEDAELLKKVYSLLTKKVYYQASSIAIHDGTSYHFSIWDDGIKSGMFRSPNDSISKTLLTINEKIFDEIGKKKNVSLSLQNRNTLLEIITELNNFRKIENYELAIKLRREILANRDFYKSRYDKEIQPYFDEILVYLENQILVELAYNEFDSQSLSNLIDSCGHLFRNSYAVPPSNITLAELDAYGEKIDALDLDNIFIKLKSFLK